MKRSEIFDEIVSVIGLEKARLFLGHYGGKVAKIPWGSGKRGCFTKHLIELLGEDAYKELVARFGGERLYLPKTYSKADAMAARNRKILADFASGSSSMLDLVRRYDLCERQIRTILNYPTE